LFLCHNKNHVLCTHEQERRRSFCLVSLPLYVLSNAPSSKQITENRVLHWSKNNNNNNNTNGCITMWPFHLSMKEGSLFYFVVYEIHRLGMSHIVFFLVLWKALH
jgi:hypothetical protein